MVNFINIALLNFRLAPLKDVSCEMLDTPCLIRVESIFGDHMLGWGSHSLKCGTYETTTTFPEQKSCLCPFGPFARPSFSGVFFNGLFCYYTGRAHEIFNIPTRIAELIDIVEKNPSFQKGLFFHLLQYQIAYKLVPILPSIMIRFQNLGG